MCAQNFLCTQSVLFGTQIDQKRLCKRYIQVSRRRKFDFENKSIDVPVVPKKCVFSCNIGETQLYLFENVYHVDMNNVLTMLPF